MDRRSFLLLGAATVALSACTPDPRPPVTPTAPAPSTRADDDLLRERVATSELALVAAYRDALARAPDRSADLGGFLEHHLAHLARVAPGTRAGPAPSSAGPSPGAGSSPTAAPADVELVALLQELASAEQQARDERTAACDDADSGELARDLALIAGSEAQHATALGELAAAAAP